MSSTQSPQNCTSALSFEREAREARDAPRGVREGESKGKRVEEREEREFPRTCSVHGDAAHFDIGVRRRRQPSADAEDR